MTTESCAPFIFDSAGNNEEANNQYTYNNEMKDYQWLGASIDGGAGDGDKTVVSSTKHGNNSEYFQNIFQQILGLCTATHF